MKVKNTLILLAVSAISAVSCNLFSKFDMDVPVSIDETANTPATTLLGVDNDKFAAITPDGDLCLCYEANEPAVSSPMTLTTSPQKIGSISIPVEKVPDYAIGATPDSGQLLIEVDNPSSEDMVVKGSVSATPLESTRAKVNAKTCTFEFTVPANKIGFKVLLKPVGATPLVKADLEATTEPKIGDIMSGTKYDGPLMIDVNGMKPGMKTSKVALAAASQFKANGKFLHPITFKKGTKIRIVKSFSDLGLNLTDYSVKAKNYDIKCDVTNSLPFEITGAGDSVEGVKAEISTPIKAGTVASPVTTSATIAMTNTNGSSVINDASIALILTAASDGAKFNKSMGLKVYYKDILFHSL